MMENSYFMWLHVDLFMIAIKLLWHYYKHCYNYHKINITKPPQINTLYYCSVLSLCPVFSFPFSVHKKKNKYIYQSYYKDYYNNNHYIMGIFSCPCCVCAWWWCVCAGSRGLLKLLQVGRCWQAGKYWERCRRQSGTGGCSQQRITAGLRWYRGMFWRKNNGIEPDGNIWQSI